MRIGIDARLWSETGVGRYTRNLIHSLEKSKDAQKHEFVVFLRSNEFQKLSFNNNFKKVEADIRWHSIDEQLKFPGIMNSQDLDLMHFTYFSIPILYKKPFVITIHDLIIHSFPTGKASTHILPLYYAKRQAYKYVISGAAKNALKIIAPSHATKNEIIEKLNVDPGKIVVTHEGVDDFSGEREVLSDVIRDRVGGKYFLYVGNAYPHKNVHFLIRTFLEFSKKEKEARLVLVGKEDYFYTLLKNEYNNENKIVFLSEIPDSDLFSLYKNSLAVISPSLMEGFGLTPLEGLKSGTIGLVSDIPVFREVLGNVVFYFDPRSKESFLQQLSIVYNLSEAERKRMVEKGMKLSQSFSWSDMAQKTLRTYESSISI